MKRCRLLIVLAVFALAFILQVIPAQAFPVSSWYRSYEGIEYATGYTTSPRLMRAFALRVSFRNPDVNLFASPGNGGAPYDCTLQGTDAFVNQFGLKAATNVCHWDVNTPSPYADVLGLLISNGSLVSSPGGIWPNQLDFSDIGTALFYTGGDYPGGVWQGVEVGDNVLSNGVPTTWAPALNPYTGLGITQDGKFLIMVCVDGRQPGWSDGCYYSELGQWLKDFGAWNACHADGGGSTCMVVAGNGVVNRPCYGYVRPVAASLGASSVLPGTTGGGCCKMNANRVDMVTRGYKKHIIWKSCTNGVWSSWVDLGGATDSSPAIVSRQDGVLDVFYRGLDNQLYHKGYANSTWTNWESMGGNLLSGPSVCSMNANHWYLVYRAADDTIWYLQWLNGTYTYGSLLGQTQDDPCIIARSSTVMDLFERCSANNQLYWKTCTNGT